MKTNYFFERNLPHFHPKGETYFITFRLYGTLPNHIIKELEVENIKDSEKAQKNSELIEKLYSSNFEKYLDKAKLGNKFLEIPEIATIICDSMHHLDYKEYTLICYTVMPNHVHFVFDHIFEGRNISDIMKSIKGYSAYKANKILNREGPFWHHENYDRIVRNQKELENTISYVLENPVKAGLIKDWEKWPYSYLNDDYM